MINKRRNAYFIIVLWVIVTAFIFSLGSCSSHSDEEPEKPPTKQRDKDYTDQRGGNRDEKSEPDGQPRTDPPISDNSIQIRIVEHTIFVNGRRFEDANSAVEYVYDLKKNSDRPVLIDLRESKAKTSEQLKDGLEDKGIAFNREGS